MEIKNCRECGKLFNHISGPRVCELCKKALEEKFDSVREFVRDNPGATIQQVCEENEVSQQQIHQWIREERLEFSAESSVSIQCETCGAKIRTGRYCDDCKKKTLDSFKGTMRGMAVAQPDRDSLSSSSKNRMRFLT